MSRVPANIAEHVGRTPMLRLARLEPEGVELYGKIEARNPCGSVKDRIGVALIEDAEKRGVLKAGSTLIEATSGNTGLALAYAVSRQGLPSRAHHARAG